ncbi:MAG: class I SAM-dependent methyltransferase [Candidatus Margulisiibacteriota bacterium]
MRTSVEILSLTDAAYRPMASDFLRMTPRMRAQTTMIGQIRNIYRDGLVPSGVKADVVDVGCGAGPDLNRFLRAKLFSGHQINAIGLDRVPEMLAVAGQHFGIPSDRLIEGCMTEFKAFFPANTVVAIWCRSTLFNVPEELHPSVLNQFNDSLIPNGSLFLRLKMGKGINQRPDGRQEKLYEKAEIRTVLGQAGLRVSRIVPYKDELGRTDVSWMGVWARKPG